MAARLAVTAALLPCLLATPASALTVTAVAFASALCEDEQEDAPAFCQSVDPLGNGVAAADEAFNGGVQVEFSGDTNNDYSAGMGFEAVYRNITGVPQPLQILSIVLPGRVQIFGDALVRLRVSMTFLPDDMSKALTSMGTSPGRRSTWRVRGRSRERHRSRMPESPRTGRRMGPLAWTSSCRSRCSDSTHGGSVSLEVIDIRNPEAAALYERKLVLLRPDQHVAWRGDAAPASPLEVIDRVRGGGSGNASTSV